MNNETEQPILTLVSALHSKIYNFLDRTRKRLNKSITVCEDTETQTENYCHRLFDLFLLNYWESSLKYAPYWKERENYRQTVSKIYIYIYMRSEEASTQRRIRKSGWWGWGQILDLGWGGRDKINSYFFDIPPLLPSFYLFAPTPLNTPLLAPSPKIGA